MWTDIQIFGFRALWSPYFFLSIVCIGLIYYFWLVRHKDEDKRPKQKQPKFFYLGLLLLYILKGSPIDLMSHIMFTAHMIQMALLFLLFPIAIIKGMPLWIWEKIFYAPILKHVLKLLTKPLISLLMFNMLFSFYHLPAIFDFTKENEVVHISATVILVLAAFIMWWPIFSPIKEMNRMQPLLKIGYIAASGVLITPACALIIFSTTSHYATYGAEGSWLQAMALCVPLDVLDTITISGPEMFSPIGLLEDQQLGGIVMKISQELIYASMIGRIFFPWFRKDEYKIDPLPVEQPTNEF